MKTKAPKILPALVAASLLATLSVRAQAPAPMPDFVSVTNGAVGVIILFQEGQPEFTSNFFALSSATGAVLFYQDAGMTVLSDQIWSVNGSFNFASAPDLQNLGTLPVLGRLAETGAPQDVSAFFGLESGHVEVKSGKEVPDTGSTCSLFGLSLMGLAFLRRKLC